MKMSSNSCWAAVMLINLTCFTSSAPHSSTLQAYFVHSWKLEGSKQPVKNRLLWPIHQQHPWLKSEGLRALHLHTHTVGVVRQAGGMQRRTGRKEKPVSVSPKGHKKPFLHTKETTNETLGMIVWMTWMNEWREGVFDIMETSKFVSDQGVNEQANSKSSTSNSDVYVRNHGMGRDLR